MATTKQIRFSIALLLACASIATPGNESDQGGYLAAGLGFIKASHPTSCSFEERPTIMPTYMATFTIRWYFAPPADPNNSDILGTSGIESVSALQRELLKSAPEFWLRTANISDAYGEYCKVPTGLRTYSLFAVTDLDAGIMAQVFVRWLAEDGTANAQGKMKEHIDTLPEIQQQLITEIAKAKENAHAKNKEMDPALRAYKEEVDHSPYALYPISDVPNEVRKSILDMEKMLNALEIEIAGIHSKLSAIKKYSTQKDVLDSETLTIALKEMAIREDIELVGTESRRQATMDTMKRQKELYQLYTAFSVIKAEVETLEDSIKRNEKELEQVEKELSRGESGALPFSVENNKVTTRPIQAVWP